MNTILYPESELTKAEVLELLRKQIEPAKRDFYRAIVGVALDASNDALDKSKRARERYVELCQIAATVAGE